MGRRDYLVRKFLFALLTLLVVLVSNFLLFRILPGEPTKMLIHEARMTREAVEKIRGEFGLDKPIWLDVQCLRTNDWAGAFDSQFVAYVRQLLSGNLGLSFSYRRPVGELLEERVGRTFLLLTAGEVLAVISGIALGLLAAWRRGTRRCPVFLSRFSGR